MLTILPCENLIFLMTPVSTLVFVILGELYFLFMFTKIFASTVPEMEW